MAEGRQKFDGTPDYSDHSSGPGSTLVGAISPVSPIRHRPTYQRLTSAPTTDELTYATIPEVDVGEDIAETFRKAPDAQGLGINTGSSPKKHTRRVSIAQTPVIGTSSSSTPAAWTPGSNDPLVSSFGPSGPMSPSALSPDRNTLYDPAAAYGLGNDDYRPNPYKRSQSSVGSTLEPYHPDTENLTKLPTNSIRSGKSGRSVYDNDFTPDACPSQRSFYQGRSNWLAISIIVLAVFSTIFSGIYLAIAIRAPRWGRTIHTNGSLTAATANVLTQLFGKLIELSFVTVFVAFLGQVLSRRAFSKESRGVTLAEMSMRNWIMQPGSIITHYESVRFASLTFLGAVSLTAAVVAMLYTTAASALVTPVLKFGPWEPKTVYGLVKTSFANPDYLSQQCATPIQVSSWNLEYTQALVGDACMEIDHAAQGYHNYQQYMGRWASLTNSGNGTKVQTDRPQGFGLFLENTTVTGSWIHIINTTAVSEHYNRIINNVTLAMPHTGVFQAARDPLSDIMQPEDLDGMGVYNLRASVPSPYLNVICANVQKDEIKGLVYEAQPNVTLNATADLPTLFTTLFNWTSFSTVKTPVDDIFSWDSQHPPPIFYKYPKNFNTILNATAPWGRDSVYLLGLGAPDMLGDYIVCKAKGGLTPYCSTEYVATGSGGTMQAHCEDPKDDMAFVRSNSSRIDTTSLDWFNVATTAITALSLGTGVTDGAASNARILTELILQDKYLNPSLPSPAEAIAVMAGCTLLMSAQDSPFVDFWNYSSTSLTPGEHQVFNASIRAQQYASGGTLGYQRGFYIVLFAVFFTNIFVLIYFMINRGLVTDFSEPPNIFSLAINSPPSKVMGGACGGGPEGRQYTVKWGVQMEGEHLYIADKTNPLAGIYASGARSESRMSFADLISRWKWRQVDNPAGNSPDNIELGRSSTTYTGAGVDDEEEGPLRSGNTRKPDLSLGRMYSKISKRKSVL